MPMPSRSTRRRILWATFFLVVAGVTGGAAVVGGSKMGAGDPAAAGLGVIGMLSFIAAVLCLPSG